MLLGVIHAALARCVNMPMVMETVATTPPRTTLVVRTIDAADRAHARAASRLHDVRNGLRSTALRGLDRVEHAVVATFRAARDAITRVDAKGADAVNRAQGVVGAALDKARTWS